MMGLCASMDRLDAIPDEVVEQWGADDVANIRAATDELLYRMRVESGEIWECGHVRLWRTTQVVNGVERCRTCRREAAEKALRIAIIRQMAGQLERLQKSSGKALSLAEKYRRRIEAVDGNPDRMPVSDLLHAIAEGFQTTVAEMKGARRNANAVNARAVFCRILFDRGVSYPVIGSLIGGRDHSTVINSVAKFDWYCRRDPRVSELYHALRDAKRPDAE